jgi:hypothetical protein
VGPGIFDPRVPGLLLACAHTRTRTRVCRRGRLGPVFLAIHGGLLACAHTRTRTHVGRSLNALSGLTSPLWRCWRARTHARVDGIGDVDRIFDIMTTVLLTHAHTRNGAQ